MIEVRDLSMRAGEFHVREVNLSVEPGQYFVLLGPTGSGKTLLISCLCGLIKATGGQVTIGGEDVTALEPRLRGIGYVPQNCGIFAHMSVAKNLTFPLRVQGNSHRRALKQIESLIDILRLGPLLHRSAEGLSGGEQQMVALGRALAVRPKLLLLDEPVSALDEPTRRSVCAEIRRVQRELMVATIHVCHNLDEALSVADRAGVMYQGRLIQTGTLDDLMFRPRTEAVGRLTRAENIFSGQAVPDGDGCSLLSFAGLAVRVAGRHEGAIRFMVRPERVRIAPAGGKARTSMRAVLTRVELRGAYCRLELDAYGTIVAYVPAADLHMSLKPGAEFTVEFPPESVYVFPE